MATTRLLVIGAGPKALAIVTKAAVLKELHFSAPEIVVIEKNKVASNWIEGSYTDGRQQLGTPPEKDVGFPYRSQYGIEADLQMLQKYSWQAFHINKKSYSEWVDRGRQHPPHEEWADYLNWVKDRVQLAIEIGEVQNIEAVENRWRLKCVKQGADPCFLEGDGLVVTGPGNPILIPDQPQEHPRVFNGKSFWKYLKTFEGLKEGEVAVVGSGETAASIVVALLQRVGKYVTIWVLNRQGAIFSRGESFDENKKFTNPSDWEEMNTTERREFIGRTDRGVFSLQSKRIIDQAWNVRHRKRDVTRFVGIDDERVVIKWRRGREEEPIAFDYLIVATAFDALWFRYLMAEPWQSMLSDKRKVERRIQMDLSVTGVKPKLHLPMLAGPKQGHGFPNLSCLGHLSDRILMPYVRPRRESL